MKKLSVGCNSTLQNWRHLSAGRWGEDSPAVKFLDEKIQLQGADQEVEADETQFIELLISIIRESREETFINQGGA